MKFPPSYFVGLDLGKRQDYTALAVIEEPLYVASDEQAFAWGMPPIGTGWLSPAGFVPATVRTIRAHNFYDGRPAQPPLSVRHLERFPLGTRYPVIVQRVAALMRTVPLAGDAVLIVDGTGVGAAVVDDFRLALHDLKDVTITGGTNVNFEPPDRYKVPKRDLVSAVQSLLQADRLRIARELQESQTLVDELLAFQVTITEAANDRYEGRSGAHDDLVLAVAMPCWFRGWYSAHIDAAAESLLHAGYEAEV
jgi:hypothetical protein